MQEQLWVEPVGDIIIARLRGVPTETMMKECQARVLQLLQDTARGKVLYDGLEMESPSVDIALAQQKLEAELGAVHLRRAIVVPSSRIAYLARLAFGEGDYRVFYSDMTAAIKWLQE
ncbi:MAG: hypothetical protein V7642_6102 [Burkholderiales bacterium]|jgi:hypothetical protein